MWHLYSKHLLHIQVSICSTLKTQPANYTLFLWHSSTEPYSVFIWFCRKITPGTKAGDETQTSFSQCWITYVPWIKHLVGNNGIRLMEHSVLCNCILCKHFAHFKHRLQLFHSLTVSAKRSLRNVLFAAYSSSLQRMQHNVWERQTTLSLTFLKLDLIHSW